MDFLDFGRLLANRMGSLLKQIGRSNLAGRSWKLNSPETNNAAPAVTDLVQGDPKGRFEYAPYCVEPPGPPPFGAQSTT